MPWIIDYQSVLDVLGGQGLNCHYHNSGAFGFAPEAGAQVRGWIGPPDPTIKPGARHLVRQVAPPHEQNLADLATRVWQQSLRGRVWLMPTSHWHYELNYGSRQWMPAVLENQGLDPGLLETRNNAAAIEYSPGEAAAFQHFVQRLLEMLVGSDFMIAFPGRPALCTLHHHKQLWWMSPDEPLMHTLDLLVPNAGPAPAL